jgi:hypothetical protein
MMRILTRCLPSSTIVANAVKSPLILEDVHAAIAAIHHMIKTSPAAGIQRARRGLFGGIAEQPRVPGPRSSGVSRSVPLRMLTNPAGGTATPP